MVECTYDCILVKRTINCLNLNLHFSQFFHSQIRKYVDVCFDEFYRNSNIIQTEILKYHKIDCYTLHTSTRRKNQVFEKNIFKCVTRPVFRGSLRHSYVVNFTMFMYVYCLLICIVLCYFTMTYTNFYFCSS